MKNEEIFLDILEAIEDNTTFVEADKIKIAYNEDESRYYIAANKQLYPMDAGAVEKRKDLQRYCGCRWSGCRLY